MDNNTIAPVDPGKVTAEEKVALTTIATKIIQLIRDKHL